MPTIAEFYFVAVFDGKIFEAYQLVFLDVYEADFVGEGDYEMLTGWMEWEAEGFLFELFDNLESVLLEIVPNSDSAIGWTSSH